MLAHFESGIEGLILAYMARTKRGGTRELVLCLGLPSHEI